MVFTIRKIIELVEFQSLGVRRVLFKRSVAKIINWKIFNCEAYTQNHRVCVLPNVHDMNSAFVSHMSFCRICDRIYIFLNETFLYPETCLIAKRWTLGYAPDLRHRQKKY